MKGKAIIKVVSLLFTMIFIYSTVGCSMQGKQDKSQKSKEQQGQNGDKSEKKEEDENSFVTPEESTFFSTVSIEDKGTYNLPSDGDLWPSAWSDDDYLYTANGDGKGFNLGGAWSDIVVNRIGGNPDKNNLKGERLSNGSLVGRTWNVKGGLYNMKPTGMTSVDGNLYLAVQDLNKNGQAAFNDSPSATIVKSTNKGKIWTFDNKAPMFDNYVFTTIMFLDYGKDSENSIDEYVYAYGMDNNWRDSFNNSVEDPTKLYLARMPKSSIQDRSKWEFYNGDLSGKASWSRNIDDRKPVLRDDRRVYENKLPGMNGIDDMSVISQGSIVYNKPLDRYIYTSWTEYTFEFYEAPTPWGPWKKFTSKDFGMYPWTENKHGGYAAVIPSKYISEDGNEMWVVSATFMGGYQNYKFSMRKLKVSKYVETEPANTISTDNIALDKNAPGVTPFVKSSHFGNSVFLNDGVLEQNEDSWNGESKELDWWGYTWPKEYNMNKVVYTTGNVFSDGGWFDDLKVQVRQNFVWKDVSSLSSVDKYPNDSSAGTNKSFTFIFNETTGDGIRIIGKPGGTAKFTSIAELEVFYSKE